MDSEVTLIIVCFFSQGRHLMLINFSVTTFMVMLMLLYNFYCNLNNHIRVLVYMCIAHTQRIIYLLT